MDVDAAQRELVDVHSQRLLHHRRAAGEETAIVFGHDGEVREMRAGSRAAGRGPEHGREHRYLVHEVEHRVGRVDRLQLRVADGRLQDDRAAHTVDQHDQRYAIAERELLDKPAPAALVAVQVNAAAAAFNRIVLGADRYMPAVDFAEATDEGRGKRPAVLRRRGHEGADLEEAALVDQLQDAFARGGAVVAVLARDLFRAAGGKRELAPPLDFLEQRLPFGMRRAGHGQTPCDSKAAAVLASAALSTLEALRTGMESIKSI